MRVILDTNVLVSLVLVRRGRLAPIWDAWRGGRIEILTSERLLAEVTDVLARPKLAKYVDLAARDRLLEDLQTITSVVNLREPYPPFADESDRFLLAIARDGAADALVTGDGELQELGQMGETVIVSPADFLSALDGG